MGTWNDRFIWFVKRAAAWQAAALVASYVDEIVLSGVIVEGVPFVLLAG